MKRAFGGAAVLLAAGMWAVPAGAQYLQQGEKLVGTGSFQPSYQGSCVALSADGNTALVGGYYDTLNAGATWVYTRNGTTWSQQGPKLVGSGHAGVSYQGIRCAVSADGNTAVIGATGEDTGAGAAWVFDRANGVWTQTARLTGAGASGKASLGLSVAISGDASTILIGGASDETFTGAGWVFTKSDAGVWTQQAKLVGTGTSGDYSGQGFSVALSYDGSTAAMGGRLDGGDVGAVWVFTRGGRTWTQQGSKLIGTGAIGAARQGWSVALSSDGNTLLSHGANDNNFAGAAWVFTRSNGTWTQQGAKLVGVGLTGNIGSVDQGHGAWLSADGNTAVIGRANDGGGAGAVWVFTRDYNGNWSQSGNKLVGSGQSNAAAQGYAVALSGDANTILTGAPSDFNKTGAAWVFAANPVRITSVNVAGGGADLAQNTWIEIKGAGLAPAYLGTAGATWEYEPEFAAGRMPAQLKGVSVRINNKPAYMYYVSPAQINVLTPLDGTTGTITLQVTNGTNTSAAFTTTLKPAAPSFLLLGASMYVTALHADYSRIGPRYISSYPFTPARPNETIIVYGTGFGLPATPLQDGASAQSGSLPRMPEFRIGGALAQVSFAGVVSPGLYQFNVVVPAGVASGDNTITASYGGVETPAGRLLPVER